MSERVDDSHHITEPTILQPQFARGYGSGDDKGPGLDPIRNDPADPAAESLTEMEEELSTLRDKIARINDVNLGAIEVVDQAEQIDERLLEAVARAPESLADGVESVDQPPNGIVLVEERAQHVPLWKSRQFVVHRRSPPKNVTEQKAHRRNPADRRRACHEAENARTPTPENRKRDA